MRLRQDGLSGGAAMKLLDFFNRCRAADWTYQFAERDTFTRGRDAMDELRRLARQSVALQHIFDEMKRLGETGKDWPEFGDVIPMSDATALDEAIAHHDRLAVRAWTAAKMAEDSRMKPDQSAVAQYYFHNAIAARLIGYRHTVAMQSTPQKAIVE